MSYNVLQNAHNAVIENEPFPHIVIDNALPDDVFERLSRSYPDGGKMVSDRRTMNNQRYNLLSRWGATEFPFDDASEDWRKFVEANESTDFVRQAYSLFPDFVGREGDEDKIDLTNYGPELAKKIDADPMVSFDEVKPRVTVAVNTPVRKMSVVRGPHTDNLRKAYVGLLYFRLPEDDSTGGDLDIYKWKNDEPQSHWPISVPDMSAIEKVKTIEYRPNRLIFFLANDRALHGVSPRSVTPHWRRLVVISGWFPGVDYYDTDTMHGRFSGVKARIKSLARRVMGQARVTSD